MRHLTGITGGAGAYESAIYRLTDGGPSKLFGSPDRMETAISIRIFRFISQRIYPYRAKRLCRFYTVFTRKGPEEIHT